MDPINPVAGNPTAANQTPEIMPEKKTVQEPASAGRNITILAMAIFVLLSLGAVAFLYYQNQQLKNMLASYQAPATSPTPATTTNPTANWKTYINEKYGYEIKYPQNLRRINCEGENEMFYIAMAGDTPISDLIEPQNCARDSRYNLEIVASNKQFPEDSRYNTTKTKYVVAGVEAIKIEFVQKPGFEGPGEAWYTEINFKKGNYYFQAYTRNKDLEGTLDNILSTFKFLPKTDSLSPTTITYTGLGVSFAYSSALSLATPVNNTKATVPGGSYQQSFNGENGISALLNISPRRKNADGSYFTLDQELGGLTGKHISVDGNDAVLFENMGDIPNQYNEYFITTTKDGKSKIVFNLFVQPAKESALSQAKNIFNQILSTFKFKN